MTRDELVELLRGLAAGYGRDEEDDHVRADEALLKFIDDADVTKAFEAIAKWYA